MRKNNTVSIITPLYNKEQYIEETILSVCAQTYQDWELIVVDDCSTDDGAAVVKKYMEMDSRIHYYKNEENMGAAKSRNQAIELARGRYLAFLDADDLWDSKKLEIQIGRMEKEQWAFSYTACDVVDGEGKKTGQVRHVPDHVDYAVLLRGNPMPCLTVVLDQNQITDIQMKKMGHEDYILWLDIMKRGICAYGVDEILASYREYGSSLSGDKKRSAGWMWQIYRNYLHFGILKSSYYFGHYVVNALRKRGKLDVKKIYK